jgi:hypothetical protein
LAGTRGVGGIERRFERAHPVVQLTGLQDAHDGGGQATQGRALGGGEATIRDFHHGVEQRVQDRAQGVGQGFGGAFAVARGRAAHPVQLRRPCAMEQAAAILAHTERLARLAILAQRGAARAGVACGTHGRLLCVQCTTPLCQVGDRVKAWQQSLSRMDEAAPHHCVAPALCLGYTDANERGERDAPCATSRGIARKTTMGADIHGWVEVRRPDRDEWDAAFPIDDLVYRQYGMFASLFGVRNGGQDAVLEHGRFHATAPGRGEPPGASSIYLEDRRGNGAVGESWILWSELATVNWDEEGSLYLDSDGTVRGEPGPDRQRERRGDYLNGGWETLLKMMGTLAYHYGDENVRLSVWFDQW